MALDWNSRDLRRHVRRRKPRAGALEQRRSPPSITRSPAACGSFEASRLLNTAAATLAAGVLTDSAVEHYRAGFHNRAMFIAPAVSAAALTTATASALTRPGHGALSRAVFAASVATGVVGFGFHVTNVSRRVGGWNSENLFHAAPVAAPLAITMAGLLGFAASGFGRRASSRDNGAPGDRSRAAVALGTLCAGGLIGTTFEAGALHFRGAFQNPFMYAPVIIPPIAAATLATAAVTRSPKARQAAGRLLRLTTSLGVAGVGFHAWGVRRRMGGWRN